MKRIQRSMVPTLRSTVLASTAAAALVLGPVGCNQNPGHENDQGMNAMDHEKSMQNDHMQNGEMKHDGQMQNGSQNGQMHDQKMKSDEPMKSNEGKMQSRKGQTHKEGQNLAAAGEMMQKAHRVMHAIVMLEPTKGNDAHGTVKFDQTEGKVKITATVRGLKPGSVHAIHVHQYGDISSDDGKAAGGHFNPEDVKHGLPSQAKRHVGDLGNLKKANQKGVAKKTITVKNMTIDGKQHAVLGRAVIVHAKKDDGGQPTGHAGARIAQGVIGVANNQ